MIGSRPLLAFSLLLAAAFALACGSSHKLQSVTVTPTTADAKDFPSGKVPFTAIGTFSSSPSPTPLSSGQIQWCYGGANDVANPVAGLCAGNIAQFASVDQNGVAQCTPQAQGTFYILAGVSAGKMNPDAGDELTIFGSAQLTCP